MNHKTRAMLFALAAAFVVATPVAFAANSVGGPDTTISPGAAPISVYVANDNALRGLSFGYELVLPPPAGNPATSATVTGLTINTARLGSRRTLAASPGYVYLAGRASVGDDLAANPAGAALVTVHVDVQGATGQKALLIIKGTSPFASRPLFVGTEPTPSRTPVNGDTIVITLRAKVVTDIVANCPGTTVIGGGVAIHAKANIQAGVFQSLNLISIKKNGTPTVPANAPKVVGLGLVDAPNATELILSWSPAAGETGTWQFCFETRNDLGDADTGCASVVVNPAGPDRAIWAPAHIEYTCGAGPFSKSFVLNYTTSYDSTFGIVGPFVLRSASGGAYFANPLVIADVVYPAAFSVFESQSTNSYANDAVSPDSILSGLIDFGGSALSPGTYGVRYNATLKDQEGIMRFDKAAPPGFPPANLLSYNVTGALVVDPDYGPGCYAITCVRNLPPTVQCPAGTFGPVIFGDPVSIPGFTYNDPDGGPGPYTFSVICAIKDGNAATPTNAPGFAGDIFQWQTSNADNNDVGCWQFCVQVNDGADNSTNTCTLNVCVIAQVPLVCFGIGSVEAFSNSDICVPLSIDNLAGGDGCKELGGFDLLFTYDASMLTFKGLDLTGSVLQSSGWEYFTYRVLGTNPGKVRLVAIADMNNSNLHPNNWCIDGLIAQLCFKTTNDRNLACQSSHLRFFWDDCGDNTASSRDGNTLYIITNPYGPTPWYGGDPARGIPGGGIIESSQSIERQLATFQGGVTGPAGFPCLNPDPRKPNPVECLYFVNGKIKIKCPGDIDDRGDINLNGLAYEIADAVLYSNYFISGPGVFYPPPRGEAQIAASDVNADGNPLTVADLVYLIRVITGDAQPIAGDILGGGPKVATVVGKLDVLAVQQGLTTTVRAQSEQDMGAALFVFRYENTEISAVSVAGRASGMSMGYRADNGELRVLVYDIENRGRVPAGSGEILHVTTTGTGSLELVSVEAASFMGGALDATVAAKVLPTAYALHQNFPNPFNPSTSMALDLPKASDYKLTIYNIAGQVVRTYAGHSEAGTVKITWDGTNNQGARVASGVYFYSAQAEAFSAVRKMVLMK